MDGPILHFTALAIMHATSVAIVEANSNEKRIENQRITMSNICQTSGDNVTSQIMYFDTMISTTHAHQNQPKV